MHYKFGMCLECVWEETTRIRGRNNTPPRWQWHGRGLLLHVFICWPIHRSIVVPYRMFPLSARCRPRTVFKTYSCALSAACTYLLYFRFWPGLHIGYCIYSISDCPSSPIRIGHWHSLQIQRSAVSVSDVESTVEESCNRLSQLLHGFN